jgi:hypothetical protein
MPGPYHKEIPFMESAKEPLEMPAEERSDSEGAEAHPMDAFLEEEAFGMETPRRGEMRTGTIARISGNDILVDIGAKSEGMIPASGDPGLRRADRRPRGGDRALGDPGDGRE